MVDQEFQVGDIVKLKSDGPPMTVNKLLEPSEGGMKYLECYWFDDKKQLKKGEFASNAVEHSNETRATLADLLSTPQPD